ncbi:NmrA/HSCARG family protein [bacterium]|nr:MAG: NmrA/HSCARG family protein [bacterium]
MNKKTIAVIGATGAQGGGLVRSILDEPDGQFAVRAITRNPESEAAQALAERGAEVVKADLSDAASIERAFEGAHGAYCVTFFWDHFSPEREIEEAKTMARAAAKTGVKHVIWSTLEDTRGWMTLDDPRMPTLMGRYKVPHLDAKGEANAYFAEAGVPTTYLLTSFYWDNFIHFGMGPQPGSDGRLAITLPMGDRKLPGIAAEDIGRCALGVFKQGEAATGGTIGIAGEHLSGEEMANAFSKALGQQVVYNAVPADVYRSFGFPGADDLGNMFQFKHDFNEEFCRVRNVETSRELNPRLQSFAQWLEASKDRLLTPSAA